MFQAFISGDMRFEPRNSRPLLFPARPSFNYNFLIGTLSPTAAPLCARRPGDGLRPIDGEDKWKKPGKRDVRQQQQCLYRTLQTKVPPFLLRSLSTSRRLLRSPDFESGPAFVPSLSQCSVVKDPADSPRRSTGNIDRT